jgi:tetratricopeptide (TPR) repeat protein/transcriptional regulator with XRE-family HTH domain
VGTEDLPAWAVRLRTEREARHWTQAESVRALRSHADHRLPDDMLRQWKRWERGTVRPGEHYQPLIAAVFGTVTAALFDDQRPSRGVLIMPPASDPPGLIAVSGMDTIEIVERIRRSDVTAGTLEALRFKADQLCREYPYMPAEQLKLEGRDWLNRLTQLLGTRLTLTEHREILVIAGWLALLVGCVEYDTGDSRSAEATRAAALQLGTEADHGEIVAWAHEMKAWQALTNGRYQQVIEAARSGRAVTNSHSVAVQLSAQEAKAWARMGDRRMVENTLEQARVLLEALPYPENPDHHFVVDPDKFDFYAMDCYRLAQEDRLAEIYAQEVLRKGTAPDGTELFPMRMAEAHVTLGVVAARRGDLDTAQDAGAQALAGERRSLPSLLLVASELRDEMATRAPDAPETVSFQNHLATLGRSA